MMRQQPWGLLLCLSCWWSLLLLDEELGSGSVVNGFSFFGVNSSISRRRRATRTSSGVGDKEERTHQYTHHPRISRSSSSVVPQPDPQPRIRILLHASASSTTTNTAAVSASAADININNNNNKATTTTTTRSTTTTTTTSPSSIVRLALLLVVSDSPSTSSSSLSTTPPTSPSTPPPSLSPFEITCVTYMEEWYRKALKMKCPFLRRRASDLLDAADMIMRFLIIRHKSLDLLGPPPGHRCQGTTCRKAKGLDVAETINIIKRDWRTDTNKGYYITGKLNTTIYRDDCLFDGPDPDMPVRGLRKYLNAASQLFDQGKSRSQLLSLDVVNDDGSSSSSSSNGNDKIIATWKMNGILRLPWSPVLPTWTGTTTYHRDVDGLIYLHTETWDMSVLQAFLRTFWPSLARRIWCNNGSISISPDTNEMEECLIQYDD